MKASTGAILHMSLTFEFSDITTENILKSVNPTRETSIFVLISINGTYFRTDLFDSSDTNCNLI